MILFLYCESPGIGHCRGDINLQNKQDCQCSTNVNHMGQSVLSQSLSLYNPCAQKDVVLGENPPELVCA